MQCGLVGISLAIAPGRACYIPVAHRKADGLDFGGEAIMQMPRDRVIEAVKPILEDPAILKIGHNVKYDIQVLGRCGINLAPYDDTMLMSYAMESGLSGHGMDELSEKHLAHKPISFKDVVGSGRSQVTVYETLERPLASVLAHVERQGVLVDRQVLARLSGEFAQAAARLEEEIFALSGER